MSKLYQAAQNALDVLWEDPGCHDFDTHLKALDDCIALQKKRDRSVEGCPRRGKEGRAPSGRSAQRLGARLDLSDRRASQAAVPPCLPREFNTQGER
jgi:hypothetical protein